MNGHNTASTIMVKNVPIAYTDQTIRHVEKMLLDNEADYETIRYIYVVNKQNHLRGVVSIKDLFRLPKGSLLSEVMTKNPLSVHPHTHREKIVMLALEHNIKALPVVEKDDTLLGVVPADVIISAAHEELTEDLYRLEGITGKESHSLSVLRTSPFKLLFVRLPWLLLGLVGGVFAATVVGYFENLLAEEIALVGFLPLMVYMSDAVGSQSQTIYIRSLAVEKNFSFGTYLFRELSVALLISTALSFLLGAVISFIHAPYLGIILGTSLFFTVIASVLIAIITPSVLTALGKDPAVGSGPFATIIRDIMSIFIYFFIASTLLSTLKI